MKQLSGKLDIQEILSLINTPDTHAEILGYRVSITGVRLRTFAEKGVDCIACDAKGSFFRIEDNTSGPHLNLYGLKDDGAEVLMTRDHIIPHSHGGSNSVDNMNPMCLTCNNARGTQDLSDFLLGVKPKDSDITTGSILLNSYLTNVGITKNLNYLFYTDMNNSYHRGNLIGNIKVSGDTELLKLATHYIRSNSVTRKELRRMYYGTHGDLMKLVKGFIGDYISSHGLDHNLYTYMDSVNYNKAWRIEALKDLSIILQNDYLKGIIDVMSEFSIAGRKKIIKYFWSNYYEPKIEASGRYWNYRIVRSDSDRGYNYRVNRILQERPKAFKA